MKMLSRALCCIATTPIVLAWPNSISAMPSCEGTYAATLLRPLPERISVGLDIRDASPRNQRLADRFLAGIREAGVRTGAASNVTLHVSTSRLNGASTGSGRGIERSYSGLSGMQVGKTPSLPAMPGNRLSVPPTPQIPPMLILRIDATEGQEKRISWVASVQCRPTGTDDGQLAQDLGRIIGRALGKRIERSAL